MTYDQLDTIADAYIPIIWLCCLARLYFELLRDKKFSLIPEILSLPVIVYGWMFIDQHLKLWPVLNLDYSTHTAAAMAGVYFLLPIKKARVFCVLSLLSYYLLMLYQEYHSVLDILTTKLIIGSCLVILHFICRFLRANHPMPQLREPKKKQP